MVIGAGRETKESIIDHAVGIRILKKVGDKVEKDEVIAKIYYNDESKVNASKEMILESYVIGNEKLEVITPILDIIE